MTDYRTVPVELLNSAAGLLHNGGFFALADALNGIIDASPAPAGDLVERVARTIAEGLGDNFDHAFVSKPEWTAARGEKGGRYRDINEPMQPDYLDAARAVIAAMQPVEASNA